MPPTPFPKYYIWVFFLIGIEVAKTYHRTCEKFHTSTRQGGFILRESPSNTLASLSTSSTSASPSSSERSPRVWEYDARHAINTKNFAYAEILIKSLNNTVLPNGRNAVYVISETCKRSKNTDIVLRLLNCIPDTALRLSEDDVMPLLSDCVSSGDIQTGQQLVTWMECKGALLSAKTYSVLLKGYGRQQNVAMVDKVLQTCSRNSVAVDTIFLNVAMDAYIEARSPSAAVDLYMSITPAVAEDALRIILEKISNERDRSSWVFYNANNIRPNIRTFNTLLKALRSGGDRGYYAAMDIIGLVRSGSVATDAISLNTLTHICTQNGDFETAEKLLLDFPAGVEAYSALVSGYASKGMVPQAFALVDLMKSRGIRPNKFTLTSLMHACFKSGNIGAAKSLLKKATAAANSTGRSDDSARHTENLEALHGAFVIGLSKILEEDTVRAQVDMKEAFLTMLRLNLTPDAATINAFIQRLCNGQPSRYKEALEIVNTMTAKGFRPDDFTYTILFTALGREGELEEVKSLFQSAVGIKFDATTMNSLLKAYAAGPAPLAALDLFDEFTKRNYQRGEVEYFVPTKVTYTILYYAISRMLCYDQLRNGNSADFNRLQGRRPINYDRIARKLFRSMRFDYEIEVDEGLTHVINKLFDSCIVDPSIGFFTNQIYIGLSKETARLICEDFLFSGRHPNSFLSILNACDYPDWKRVQIINKAGSVNPRIQSSRNPASYRIFNKYGWNKVESGWTSLF